MKIRDIIIEGDIHANPTQLASDQVSSLKGALSIPGISGNKSNGSPYAQYRFMIATGLVDGKGTGEQMPAAGAMAGDPLITCYTDEEFGMIKDAAKMIGAGSINQLSNEKSMESKEIQKASPTRQVGAIQRRSK